jgi:hypothetical protein
MPAKAGIHVLPAEPKRQNKESSFFEKKEAKKLLLLRAVARACPRPQDQKFFASFFQKRSASF